MTILPSNTSSASDNRAEYEERMRTFLCDELMRQECRTVDANDPLDLDSLDQTELRVFLEEEFNVGSIDRSLASSSISAIVDLIVDSSASTSAVEVPYAA